MKRLILFCLMLAAADMALEGQTRTLGLDDCIGLALQRNPEILLGRIACDKSRTELLQSEAELLPTLNLYANQYYNWGRSVDMQELVIVKNRLTRQTSGSVGASFSLFDGFTSINTVRLKRQLLLAEGDNARRIEAEVKAEVARAYLGNILARLEHSRLGESLKAMEGQAARLTLEVEAGSATRSGILEMEAKMAEIQSQIADASARENMQLVKLKALTGCGESFATDTLLPPPASEPPAEGIHALADAMPAVAAARHNLKAAELALKVAKGSLLPSLSVSAAYGTYYSDAAEATFRQQLENNHNPSISLGLSVPIFNAGKGAAAVAAARADLSASRIQLQQALDQSKNELAQLEQDCRTLHVQLLAAICSEELYLKRFECATAEYESGTISTSEWIDACEDLARSRCALAQAWCKYLFQKKIMEFYEDAIKG